MPSRSGPWVALVSIIVAAGLAGWEVRRRKAGGVAYATPGT
jgi:hypothetical protein